MSPITFPPGRARAVMAVTPGNQYKNLYSVFVKIRQQEGLLAMYRSVRLTLVLCYCDCVTVTVTVTVTVNCVTVTV